jgi:hypothetical protein
MIVPIFGAFLLGSVGGLAVGLYYRNMTLLWIVTGLWWVGSFISAYFVGLAWLESGYSENWAMIGFIVGSLPYSVLTITMLAVELFFIRNWFGHGVRLLRLAAILLLTFLFFQLIIGFLSG